MNNTIKEDNDNYSKLFAEEIIKNINTNKHASTVLKTDQKVLARITDGIYRQTSSALRELICNAYDADAENVYIDTDVPRFDRIIVRDDGNGMSPATLSNMLHHIGGSAKRNVKKSDLEIFDKNDPTLSPIKKRKLIGKIGIGLFSVAQLTRDFSIITKQRGTDYYIIADIVLHNFSEEQIQEIEKRGESFQTGEVNVYTRKAEDKNSHGTDIILRNLKKSAIDELRSVDVWQQALYDDDGLFLNEAKPTYHIGEVNPKQENIIKETANLPWEKTESPKQKFISLYNKLIELETAEGTPSVAKNLDKYLATLWTLGLSLPVKYIEKDPTQITFNECNYIYEIQNGEKSAKKIETFDKCKNIGEYLGLQKFNCDDFNVFIDNVEIMRPIKIIEEVKSGAKFKDIMLFYGKFEPDLSKIPSEMSGGKLKLEAFFKWVPKVIPKEHRGVSIRIHGATGVPFDADFMKWQLAEYVIKHQVLVEINIIEGFESALNIDRESFNMAHPHYQIVMRWLHKALRQVVNAVKAKKSEKKKEAEEQEQNKKRNKLNTIISEIKTSSFDDNNELKKIEITEEKNLSTEIFPISPQRIADLTEKKVSSKINNNILPKVNAIIGLLDKFGLLDELTEGTRKELFEALIKIVSYDE